MERTGPSEWTEGIVVLIVKKGEGKVVEEYKGVTNTVIHKQRTKYTQRY